MNDSRVAFETDLSTLGGDWDEHGYQGDDYDAGEEENRSLELSQSRSVKGKVSENLHNLVFLIITLCCESA